MTGPETAQAVAAFDEAAGRYDRCGAQFATPVAHHLLSLARILPDQQVLDIGCGPGTLTIPAAHAVSPTGQVTGIDLSARMLKRAQAAAASRGLGNVHVRLGDASAPPFRPQSFDVILASLVLYLLPQPDTALGRWYALLRPGGTLGFSWGAGPDPRWSPVFAAVDRYACGRPGFETYVRRLGRPADIQAMLGASGYTRITTQAHTVQVRYTGPRQWWEASWAEAPRIAWRHIPGGAREAARRDAFALLDTLREPDGTLLRRIRVGYALAHRPAIPGGA